MKLYKITDENDKTYGECHWGKNITHSTDGEGTMCGPGYTHWYTDPLLAVLLNPIHANFDLDTAHLWEGEGEVVRVDYGMKVGCTVATTIRRIKLPKVTTTHRVTFGILVAREVSNSKSWDVWADEWLSHRDSSARSNTRALDAYSAARAASCVAASHAAFAASQGAFAASQGASSHATLAALAAGASSHAAACAALAASYAAQGTIDLIRIAHDACGDYKKC